MNDIGMMGWHKNVDTMKKWPGNDGMALKWWNDIGMMEWHRNDAIKTEWARNDGMTLEWW